MAKFIVLTIAPNSAGKMDVNFTVDTGSGYLMADQWTVNVGSITTETELRDEIIDGFVTWANNQGGYTGVVDSDVLLFGPA